MIWWRVLPGNTSAHRLVYFETFEHISDAITREKEIKGWRREKKNALVELINPEWKDLSKDWFQMNGPAR
jgi:putative endonuclease